MGVAALGTWVLAALMGSYLLATWVANGGLGARGSDRPSRFAPALIFGHAGMAATGLVVWVGYLLVGRTMLVWVALAILGVVATLGATMFGLWLGGRRARARGKHVAGPRHAAESHFPPPAVLTHGVFALATVALVLVSALRVTRLM